MPIPAGSPTSTLADPGISLRRVPRTRSAVLAHTFELDETPADSESAVAVTVTDANGAEVDDATAELAEVGTGRYLYQLPAQADLSWLTVTWTATLGGAGVVEADAVEVCGAYLFTLSAARASDRDLSDSGRYTTADLARARQVVEEEVEAICDRAWVPRYARVVVDGSGTGELLLPGPAEDRTAGDVRTLRRVAVAPRRDETFVDLGADALAAVDVGRDGLLRRVGGDAWTDGRSNVVVEYEYGADAPPAELVEAMYVRFRDILTARSSGIPDRTESFSTPDGASYRLTLPEAYRTGIPRVDAVYARYSRRSQAPAGEGGGESPGGRRPVSRTFSFDPQWGSLFHGGVR